MSHQIEKPAEVHPAAGGAVSTKAVPEMATPGTAPIRSSGVWAIPGIDARLRELHAGDDSFAQIAGKLSIEFNVYLTRNAVIGRATRQRLPWADRKLRLKPKAPDAPQPERRRPFDPKRRLPGSIARAAEALSEALYLTFAELRPHQCRYAFGEHVPYTFCGLPTVSLDCSWCKRHLLTVAKPR